MELWVDFGNSPTHSFARLLAAGKQGGFMEIRVKRVYDDPSPEDGRRILVDRIWPRGLSKEKAKVDFWAKDLSPSTELRKWYGHDPEKWEEFQRRYFLELKEKEAAVSELLGRIRKGPVTFLFSSKEQRLNNAHALKKYMEGLDAQPTG